MATQATFDVVVLIDSNGDYAVAKDAETAVEAYENDIGNLSDSGGYRLVNVQVKAALPEQVELTATVSMDGKATLVLK